MKLEHIFKEAIFIAPKVYGGVIDSYEYVKVKGAKTKQKTKQKIKCRLSELKPLLIKDSKLIISQTK
jgi:hypothetical protein